MKVIIKRVLLVLFALIVLAGGIYFYLLMPTPDLVADDYDELARKITKHPELVLPDEAILPGEPTYLCSHVPGRMPFKPATGYDIVVDVPEYCFYIACTTLESYTPNGGELPYFLPNNYIETVPVEVAHHNFNDSTTISFRTDQSHFVVGLVSGEDFLNEEERVMFLTGFMQDLIESNDAI